MSDTGLTVPSPEEALPDPERAGNVLFNPSVQRLREFSDHLENTTEFGSPAYVSAQRSRSADRTKNDVDDEFVDADYRRVRDALDVAREREMVCVDRRVGRHPEHTYHCRLYVPTEYARIALALTKLLEPAPPDSAPDFLTVHVPEWEDIAIRVLVEKGITAVLGSDYTGEAKKSFLRLFMYRVKQDGGLGLHAGSKRVRVQQSDGTVDTVGQLFLGLSGTGKSTLTAHGLGLEEPERASMLQDDVCGLLPNGTVTGSEGNGLYVKTIGLAPDEQESLYRAVTHESAVLENVAVESDGTVDFDSDEYTANGRAVVPRKHLSSADPEIDLEQVDQVFFITRNPTMPPVSKLSPDEAAAAFMLGESVQTSAGDPSEAGNAVRVVGTNPFIIGPKGGEGNRFKSLMSDLDVDCYLLNTGYIGDESIDIGVDDTIAILRAIARDQIEWTDDEVTGLTIPSDVPEIDIRAFDVSEHVDDCEQTLRELRAERRRYLEQFDGLDAEITNAVY